MTTGDHHREYLARAVAALTPEGRARALELLAQLHDSASGDEPVMRFAADRRIEVDLGRLVPESQATEWPGPGDVERLHDGFRAIRDQEPRDDVSDWANAVVALLEDALNELKEAGRG